MLPRRVLLIGLTLIAALIVAAGVLGLDGLRRDGQVTVPPVPNTRSMSEAKAALEDAGLAVEVKGVPCGPPGFCNAGPIETVPQAGSVVPRGSTVVLYVRGYGDQPSTGKKAAMSRMAASLVGLVALLVVGALVAVRLRAERRASLESTRSDERLHNASDDAT